MSFDEHIKQWQRAIGVKDDAKFGPATLARSMEVLGFGRNVRDWQQEIGSPPTGVFDAETLRRSREILIADTLKPPPVAEEVLWTKALRVAENEQLVWGSNQVLPSRVASYFNGCTRDGVPSLGKWLHDETLKGQIHSFCAAAVGWCEDQAAATSELRKFLPPWRAGALEVGLDARAGARPGQKWVDLAEVIQKKAWPVPGSIAVYRNTQTAGKGHVEFVKAASDRGYIGLGANENNRRWFTDPAPVPWDGQKSDGSQRLLLLGFSVPL